MSNLKRNGKLRWAPSYLRNRGQLTRAQKRAQRELWPVYGIPFRFDEVILPDDHFSFKGEPIIIEIGFGMGDHLVQLARALPDRNVLGIEVHRPGIAAAMAKAAEAKLTNLKVMRGDARLILTDHFASRIADAVVIQFPDPWPNPGDIHRRLVQEEMVDLISQRLHSRGELLITTDVDAYADHCREILSAKNDWIESEQSTLSQYRVITMYEQKAIQEGRTVQELRFQKTS